MLPNWSTVVPSHCFCFLSEVIQSIELIAAQLNNKLNYQIVDYCLRQANKNVPVYSFFIH